MRVDNLESSCRPRSNTMCQTLIGEPIGSLERAPGGTRVYNGKLVE